MLNSITRTIFILVFFLFMFCLSGCGAKSILVKNADSLLEYQVEKRLPLYSDQKKVLSKDVKNFLKEQKSAVQVLLPVIDELSLEPEIVEKAYKELLSTYDKVTLKFSAMVSKHLAILDSKQQKDFFENLKNENRSLSKKSPSDLLDMSYERFEKLFGSINDKQKQLLSGYESYIVDNHNRKLKRRKDLESQFEKIFAQELSAGSRENLLVDALNAFHKDAHDHEKNLLIIKKLIPEISPAQIETFRKRVAEVKEIIQLYLDANY
jgi:hypothetical protein